MLQKRAITYSAEAMKSGAVECLDCQTLLDYPQRIQGGET